MKYPRVNLMWNRHEHVFRCRGCNEPIEPGELYANVLDPDALVYTSPNHVECAVREVRGSTALWVRKVREAARESRAKGDARR